MKPIRREHSTNTFVSSRDAQDGIGSRRQEAHSGRIERSLMEETMADMIAMLPYHLLLAAALSASAFASVRAHGALSAAHHPVTRYTAWVAR